MGTLCAAASPADANATHTASMILVRIDHPLCQGIDKLAAYNEIDQGIKRT